MCGECEVLLGMLRKMLDAAGSDAVRHRVEEMVRLAEAVDRKRQYYVSAYNRVNAKLKAQRKIIRERDAEIAELKVDDLNRKTMEMIREQGYVDGFAEGVALARKGARHDRARS